jgi:hypothetical protein
LKGIGPILRGDEYGGAATHNAYCGIMKRQEIFDTAERLVELLRCGTEQRELFKLAAQRFFRVQMHTISQHRCIDSPEVRSHLGLAFD